MRQLQLLESEADTKGPGRGRKPQHVQKPHLHEEEEFFDADDEIQRERPRTHPEEGVMPKRGFHSSMLSRCRSDEEGDGFVKRRGHRVAVMAAGLVAATTLTALLAMGGGVWTKKAGLSKGRDEANSAPAADASDPGQEILTMDQYLRTRKWIGGVETEVHTSPLSEAHPPSCKVGSGLSVIWPPDMTGPIMELSVMTYNLFWWSLFDRGRGPWVHLQAGDNGATKLIRKALEHTPYDLIGFQECNDERWLLDQSGMAVEYAIFRDKGSCFAYRKRNFDLITRGVNYVADDAKYGMRPAQWMRLRHQATGKGVFFINHHGPLPIDSGGMCGGRAHAFNLLKVYESEAQRGDTVVLVGDFNAVPASESVKLIHTRLHTVNGGWGSRTHIDYILTNTGPASVVNTTNLGGGGSDHDALHAVIKVGNGVVVPERPDKVMVVQPPSAPEPHKGPCSKKNLDQLEYGVTYSVAPGVGRMALKNILVAGDCCNACRDIKRCKSFTWYAGGMCNLFGEEPMSKGEQHGVVSGFPSEKEEQEQIYQDEVAESKQVTSEEQIQPGGPGYATPHQSWMTVPTQSRPKAAAVAPPAAQHM
eukprot:CAMPEP_0172676786 /NCGR_PEP_ID=MMETSP1074-20121228/14220_1 /TAXON_ID=2916 /ORGANISM="Ceratium fusus, Strain PA161109" /LENGTH=588 /DNA_ID=CAMNT_0013494521 /DNA_START=30 /DNA_END=1796 /DNA_ORIENTATION=-